jgi:hypothetical protein
VEASGFITLWKRRWRPNTGHDGPRESNGVPRVSVDLDYDDRSETRRERVLALWRLWRDLERRSTGGRTARAPCMAVSARELARELEELIAALDRRVPRVEEAGEAAIARDAAVLRARAVERLAQLASGVSVPGGERETVPMQDASRRRND